MGLRKDIQAFVDANYADGRDGKKIAKRLIEAGIGIMQEENDLPESARIVPQADGTFHVSRFTTRERSPLGLLANLLEMSPAIGSGDRIVITIDDDGLGFSASRLGGYVATGAEVEELMRETAQLLDTYGRNHLAKEPPQLAKARRNFDQAAKLYHALGETYEPEWPESGQEPAVEADSAFLWPSGPLGEARPLLRVIHECTEAEKPIRGVDVLPDDHIVLKALVSLGFVTQDDVSDLLGVTTMGRQAIGIRPRGTIDLPVEIQEITGNIAEGELAARYVDAKIAAIDKAIAKREAPQYDMQCSWEESYQHAALVLKAMADEFRMGLHIPVIHGGGRVIAYNEDRSTGISHATGLYSFFEDVHGRNVAAGWWTDIATGQPKKRSVGELFMLFVTEIAEAYEAYVDNANDDKLTGYPGLGVELADLGIRWADFCGAYLAGRIVAFSDVRNPGDAMFREVCGIAARYEAIRKTPEANGDPEMGEPLDIADVSIMVDAKLAFNATRADHKIENRLKDDGKRT